MKKILITMLFLASAKLFAQNITVQINPNNGINGFLNALSGWKTKTITTLTLFSLQTELQKKTGFLLQKTAGQNLYLYGMVNQMVIIILEYQKHLMQ